MEAFPKIIHQTWKTQEIPEPFSLWSSSWKILNPDYEYKLWTDADNFEFIRSQYPDFFDEYVSYDQHIKRVDAVRYFYLYKYGGIYCDLDFECLKNFDSLFLEMKNYEVVFGHMGEEVDFAHAIPNAIMISKPNSHFWLYLISEMRKRINTGKAEYDTGPMLLKHCCEQYPHKEKISILNKATFYGISWNTSQGQSIRHRVLSKRNLLTFSEKRTLFPNAYAITYWTHSWEEGHEPEHYFIRKFKKTLRKLKNQFLKK